MPVTNTEEEVTLTPELRLFALVNDRYEFSRAANLIGSLVARTVLTQSVEDFGFMIEKVAFRRCDPWGSQALIRVEVRVRGRNRAISFNDPQRRAPQQRVVVKEVGDYEWKSWVTGSMNNKTICTDLGLQAAVNKSVQHLLREMAAQLIACDRWQS